MTGNGGNSGEMSTGGVPLVRLSDTQQVQWLVGVDSVPEGLPLPTSRSGGITARYWTVLPLLWAMA